MNDNGLWSAVIARDSRADGLFVYAVTSTGVYCRPSCASRRPRRDRVQFFPTPAMAEANGFRGCLRCRPADARRAAPATARVQRVCEAIALRPEARWTAASLARAGASTVAQLQRAFRATLGLAPRDYVIACRRRGFLDRVRNGQRVTDAVYDAGFGSPSRVYEQMRLPGMTPATYGRGGAGATIDWMTIESPVGRIMIAATARGLSFVQIGASDAAMLDELRREFPRATISARPSARLRPLAEAAQASAESRPMATELPLDIRGTAFQWRVWRALTSIPPGETRSYAALAASIGHPTAVRAVARACATNPLSLVIPCHRVIGTNGSLTGYRWGTQVKDELLTRERKTSRNP
jgi:AraC family transcriptional regulator of adaptative response/methylated-DNA-[protein]-cysteine methyltransferase